MYFPIELWREIKNYQLGKEYWKRKMNIVLKDLPIFWVFNYKIHSSATKKIRFTKEVHVAPFFKNPGRVTLIYSIFKEKLSKSHCYGNLIRDEDGFNQILEILPD